MRGRSGGSARRDLAAAILVALGLTLVAQVVRVYVPLVRQLGEDLGGTSGYVAAGATALLVFGAPLLAAIPGVAGPGRARLGATTAALALARLAVQFVHPVPVWLISAAAAVSLIALVALVSAIRRSFGDRVLLIGTLIGLALDAALLGAFLTWDVAWREDLPAVIAAVVPAAAAIGMAVAVPVSGEPEPQPPTLRLALFGPFHALQLLHLQNPAAIAAHAELTLPEALGVVLIGDAAAAFALRVPLGSGGAGIGALLAAAGGYALAVATGPAAAALAVAEQALLVRLLARALTPTVPGTRPVTRPRRTDAPTPTTAAATAGIAVLGNGSGTSWGGSGTGARSARSRRSGARTPWPAAGACRGPPGRSYIRATIDVGEGARLVVVATHLQGGEGSDTRARQIDRVLDAWGAASPAVVAGDMNLQPDEDGVQRFLGAGLVSVQDEVGGPCEPTAWEPGPEEPCDRPDWIFATPDLGRGLRDRPRPGVGPPRARGDGHPGLEVPDQRRPTRRRADPALRPDRISRRGP
ncbi:MAG TPA: endonuclease/exonuclease/phosphatase family protein [Actinomycetota bacterium]